MQTVQVGQFKAELSSILEQVQHSAETFVIEFGKQHKKIAMLVPYQDEKPQRTFGQLRGKIVLREDFDAEDETINEMFYGHNQ